MEIIEANDVDSRVQKKKKKLNLFRNEYIYMYFFFFSDLNQCKGHMKKLYYFSSCDSYCEFVNMAGNLSIFFFVFVEIHFLLHTVKIITNKMQITSF